MTEPDIISAIRPVIDAFRKLSIDYYIGGSVASSAYGMARATMDVDIVAGIPRKSISALADALKAEYYIDAQAVADAIRANSSFNIIHLKTMFKVDVFIFKERDYDLEALNRRKEDTLYENPADKFYMASCEDVVLSKLEWFKAGNRVSERQWQDVLGVLKVQKDNIDTKYLKAWASKLGIAELLENAMNEAWPLPLNLEPLNPRTPNNHGRHKTRGREVK